MVSAPHPAHPPPRSILATSSPRHPGAPQPPAPRPPWGPSPMPRGSAPPARQAEQAAPACPVAGRGQRQPVNCRGLIWPPAASALPGAGCRSWDPLPWSSPSYPLLLPFLLHFISFPPLHGEWSSLISNEGIYGAIRTVIVRFLPNIEINGEGKINPQSTERIKAGSGIQDHIAGPHPSPKPCVLRMAGART